ncbi:TPA: hypothetical protein O4H39_004594 [Vibrio alginolyticus]|uniref:hypothetical protein n=1 Tax=Vibrio alginolyticus TaxID=663 RepID=UPI00148C451E|nr:hypothetical protein [Vibrio alginolyticus]NOI46067.1 hypothetical protein [Vibrio alginolyticus]HCZ9282949.1 hypothetical protein [Vibrio alginolyticus]HCZ9397322.1 hypothetical protein [Vibrio alginolyticus]
MNPYIEDSKLFFGTTARMISEEMDTATVVQASMSFALAMERVLKGILYEVNPIYILMDPSFKNSVSALYSSKIQNKTKEVSDNPNEDVITYRTSLIRAEVVSKLAQEKKSVLFYLSECRDVIAHNELRHLDIERMSLMLKKDFFIIADAVAKDFKLDLHNLLSHQDTRLSKISSPLQESISDKVGILLGLHSRKWDVLKQTPGYIADKDEMLAQILVTENKFSCECPACGNTAALYTKPEVEFNKYMNQEVVTGYFITRIKCVYCKFDIKDYDYISYLDETNKYDELIESRLKE